MGALFGRKTMSYGNVSRGGIAMLAWEDMQSADLAHPRGPRVLKKKPRT